MEITELTCPNCCAPLELDRTTGLAKCSYCDSTFLHSQSKKSEKKQPSQDSSADNYNDHRPAQTISFDTGTSSSAASDTIWGPITKGNLVMWIVMLILFPPITILVLIWRSDLPKSVKIGATVAVVLFGMCIAIVD